MGAAFVVTLREGFEAALIVSIVLAYLNAVGRRDRFGSIWIGVAAAVGLSLVAGLIIFLTAGALSHRAQEAFEGIVTLLAVGVLTWMIFWMRRQARYIKGELQQKVDTALESGSTLALGTIAFIAVLREGFETVLFLFAAFRAAEAESAALRVGGALLGLAAAAVIAFLIYRGGIRLNLRTFFLVTGVMLLAVAAYLINYGVHELQEIGWIPEISWLRTAIWAGYLVVTGYLFFRPARATARQQPTAVG
ncbi:MAG TPA: FTR1 family protein [Actinomycetota bacterium]|jgi:high-affinity iron transporter|nr:FTR1 family protein [Actinomycetota bacterium]